MSWISENYEKAAIGVAAVAAVGLVFFGVQKAGSVETDFSGSATGPTPAKSDPAISGSEKVALAEASFNLKREWLKGDDNGRPVDLFTGVPLYVNKNNLESPVDLMDPDVEAVHPPIPNQWWIDNRIDPGFGDSPERDADGDGFSNSEEFKAQTDPSDKLDYPGLINKLAYTGDEFVKWLLRPGYPNADGSFTFKYEDTVPRSAKAGAADPVQPGDLFFKEGPIKNRFKFIGAEKRVVLNERFNTEIEVTFVEVEDMKPNKAGMKYEFPASFRTADAPKYAMFDRTAIFTLKALDLEGQEIKIEEFASFALPPSAKEKAYTLTKVTPAAVTIEHKKADGTTVSYTILKGATGPESP